MKRTKNYGMMAEFDSVNALVEAANRTSITMQFHWWC